MTARTCDSWVRTLALTVVLHGGLPPSPLLAQPAVAPPSVRTRQADIAGLFNATAPDNWQVQPTPDGTLVIGPRNGYVTAANRQNHFTHGLQLVLLDASSGDLLAETDRVVAWFAQSNPRLTAGDGFQRETIAGRAGVVTRLNNIDSQTNVPETIVLAVTRLTDRQLLAILCVAPTIEAAAYEAACRTVRQSLRQTGQLTETAPPARPNATPSTSAPPVALPARHPLAGKWGGRRPTNGYVWEIRFEIEFRPDGTYAYIARQVSPQKRFWTLQHTGRFRYLPGDARNWDAVVELTPDPGSAAPPSEDDRIALFDILGLPDERPHKFRFRLSRMGLNSITIQPTDANPSDDIAQTWYLTTPGGR